MGWIFSLWRQFTDLTNRRMEPVRPALMDLGTICLGAAAIFFTRAFPSSGFDDFSLGMMVASTIMAVVGIALRYLSNRME